MKQESLFGKEKAIKKETIGSRCRETVSFYGPKNADMYALIGSILGDTASKSTIAELSCIAQLELANIGEDDLLQYKGIGKVGAARILAAIELGKRISTAKFHNISPSVCSPQDVAVVLMDEMKNLQQENLKVLFLNIKNKLIAAETIFVGGLNTSVVHPRDIFRVALKKAAASIVVAHNHPSGDPTPSNEDIQVTKRLIEAGEIMGVKVLDHLIIGGDRYISLKEKGLV